MSAQYVADATAKPWLPVVHITSTFPSGAVYGGSGVVVGRNDVLTAAHMAFSLRDGGAATKVEIEPAYDPAIGTGLLGTYFSIKATYSTAFDPDGDGYLLTGDGRAATRGGSELDIALLDLSVPIGDQTGWYKVDFSDSFRSGTATLAAYPARYGSLVTDTAYVFDDLRDDFVWTSLLDISPGSSGGPVYVQSGADRLVVGIVSTRLAAADPAGQDAIRLRLDANDVLIGTPVQRKGGPGADEFAGTADADILSGFEGNDTLRGGDANDRLIGGGGNDQLDGGGGRDTAYFRGPRADYAVTDAGGVVTVSDRVAGRDGTDVLTGVETLSFAKSAVYRFFNSVAGGHFFTTDPVERDAVRSTLPQYRYEGTGYYAEDGDTPGAVPVYRFFNTVAGGHFFTTDPVERDAVRARLPHLREEGVGYFAMPGAEEGYAAVYRFFNTIAGGHFFTTSTAERDAVIARLPQYTYEGIAYHVPKDSSFDL
ncbi:trypsin-like peptidase domain-containing protein [Roseomonas sp. CCTCC AB2023176]|uniref:trypsin-like peptidase domain-containing protein n=1 Tax=Roseomonas sp. CCTCC AB2023176 TaxID=3342640 RepID=UPI0035DAAC14